MTNIFKSLVTLVLVLVIAAILSVAAGCLVAAVAHYSLGWDADRSNAIGNTVISLTFVGSMVAAYHCKK